MVDVGRLVEGILLVKHRGKWRRKLCALEKQATFSSSLRLLVYDEAEKECQVQDVVHAFISFLDPSRQGTLMLVCNYKVRCISFDEFSIMNKWTEVLEANLSCEWLFKRLSLLEYYITLVCNMWLIELELIKMLSPCYRPDQLIYHKWLLQL
ncbi:hypothetical protein D915_010981 [Fasciola hepatica]|uniref:Uncharacterized protein n=1 Tax=Fasciola hepatica TaxID=6192 RepID=A0A4E0QYL1_FASHE|nr:hypothetical protein D915_010981 [Fasciola hepatica]